MKKLNKAIIIISKIMEVLFGICVLVGLGVFIAAFFLKPDFYQNAIDSNEVFEFSSFGFSINLLEMDVRSVKLTLIFSALAMFFLMACLEMIFRNINLIFRTAEGLTKFSKGKTPFQPDIIRMVKEIGYFCIAIPVIQFIVITIAKIVIGVDAVETSVEFTTLIIGLVVLCLSQFFSYGLELENDVEGLV